jgi:RecA-family ATPase
MHGIATKIAEKVGVLFQHHHANAGPRQKKAEHHSGRSAARDAALRINGAVRRGLIL